MKKRQTGPVHHSEVVDKKRQTGPVHHSEVVDKRRQTMKDFLCFIEKHKIWRLYEYIFL